MFSFKQDDQAGNANLPGKIKKGNPTLLAFKQFFSNRIYATTPQEPKETLFPSSISSDRIEKIVRKACKYVKKMGVKRGQRILVIGEYEGIEIEMWLNLETKTIESAWPAKRCR